MRRLLYLSALALLATPAAAQEKGPPNPLIGALTTCRQMAQDAARLACYDRAAGNLIGAVAQGQVTVFGKEEVRRTRRSLFGFPLPDLPIFRVKGADDKEPRNLSTTLTSMSPAGYGRYRFTVENGTMTWETVDAVRYYDGRPGDKVEIRPASLGSYFLKVGHDVWVRVRRVR
jgi:hypothetical protein